MIRSYSTPWYETTSKRYKYPSLQNPKSCEVLIIGGGLTGVSAAYHLSKAGIDTILLEADYIGYGASGRNGGQLGTGQRVWLGELVRKYGTKKAQELFSLAEQGKAYLLNFIKDNALEVDYQSGHLSVIHKASLVDDYKRHIEKMGAAGYESLAFVDKADLSIKLGSDRYFGGVYDNGTGHLNPLKLLLQTANLACKHGARIYENSRVVNIIPSDGKYNIITSTSSVTAKYVLIATNGYDNDLSKQVKSYTMPIRSYVAATEPLVDHPEILPNLESVDDSRFVVRYFRKTANNILLFGGREAYTNKDPKKLPSDMLKYIKEVYPQLANVKLTHSWGGNIALTMSRLPLVMELDKNICYIGGYSGHGVILSHFFGALYASKLTNADPSLHLIESLPKHAFPGYGYLRAPLLFLAMSWYAFLDHI